MRIAVYLKDAAHRAFVTDVMSGESWRYIICETLAEFSALCSSISPPEVLISDDLAPLLVAGGSDSHHILVGKEVGEEVGEEVGAKRELPPGVGVVSPGERNELVHRINTCASVSRLREQFSQVERLEPITRLPRHTDLLDGARRYNGTSIGIVVMQVDHGDFLYADMDPISKIDLLGHLADFIQAQLGSSHQLGFFDATCFIVLIPAATESSAGDCARQLIEAFRPGIAWRGGTLHVTASAGFAVEARCLDPERVFRAAWAAKMHAIQAGGDRAVGTPPSSLGERIPGALTREEFSLMLQAQWSISGDRLTGVETLLRWQGVEVGELAPSHFVPIAEQSGQMARIGDWVLERACGQAVTWFEHLLQPIILGVNVSPQQFEKGVINSQIQRLIAERWLNLGMLELELTHEQLLYLVDHHRSHLYRLRDLGVRFAIDGLGADLIEADKLLRCPADTLKLDRALVARLGSDPAATALASELCNLGHRFNLRTVGVGVETKVQLNALAQAGCTEVQGYLLSMPVPLEGFQSFLARRFQQSKTGT